MWGEVKKAFAYIQNILGSCRLEEIQFCESDVPDHTLPLVLGGNCDVMKGAETTTAMTKPAGAGVPTTSDKKVGFICKKC